jgi:hypothetical protein
MRALIFCTSHIDSNPGRYQDWIDYYTDFFAADDGVNFLMINDGPYEHELTPRGVRIMVFPEHLGRKSVWVFPGWKRSFRQGLIEGRKYECVAHIESDCYIRKSAKSELMSIFANYGYHAGFTKSYNFPETALQVVNDPFVVNYFVDKYACEENLGENVDFEKSVLQILNPKYILSGDRFEGFAERYKPEYQYMSGITLDGFKNLYDEDLRASKRAVSCV